MPPPQINVNNCLILQTKAHKDLIPSHFAIYFINSKRRFFVYFKHHKDMIESMRVLNDQGARYYRRDSLLPDREEYEEHIYHCNFKFKKSDLRKGLYHGTPYNDPKVHFDKYDKIKAKIETKNKQSTFKEAQIQPNHQQNHLQNNMQSHICNIEMSNNIQMQINEVHQSKLNEVEPQKNIQIEVQILPETWFGDCKLQFPEVKLILENRSLLRRILMSEE